MNASTDQLDSETHARIFEEKIASPRLLQKASYEHPKAIILGGQPGSGKGGLARAANNELADTAVTIDPDNLRSSTLASKNSAPLTPTVGLVALSAMLASGPKNSFMPRLMARRTSSSIPR